MILCSVFVGGGSIATGEHHMLTDAYFKHRQKMFQAQRPVVITQKESQNIEKRCVNDYYMAMYYMHVDLVD